MQRFEHQQASYELAKHNKTALLALAIVLIGMAIVGAI